MQRRLYAALHELDDARVDVIVVDLPPENRRLAGHSRSIATGGAAWMTSTATNNERAYHACSRHGSDRFCRPAFAEAIRSAQRAEPRCRSCPAALWRRLISMLFRGTRSRRNRRRRAFDGVDAVFHLAGDPVAEGRWTAEKKQRIRDSRVLGTRHLVDALRKLERRPSVLVSASAVGWYGSRGDEVLDETSPPAHDFLADVCVAWEQEARRAVEFGMRVVSIRTGMVLGDGGALPKMLPPFRFGLGGPLGNGKQWVPWIHVDDLAAMYLHAAENTNVSGPMNGVSPQPVDEQGIHQSARRGSAPTGRFAGAIFRTAAGVWRVRPDSVRFATGLAESGRAKRVPIPISRTAAGAGGDFVAAGRESPRMNANQRESIRNAN